MFQKMSRDRTYLLKWALGLLLGFHLIAGHVILSQFVLCAEPDGRIQVEIYQNQLCCLDAGCNISENSTSPRCQDCSDTALVDQCNEFKPRPESEQFFTFHLPFHPVQWLDNLKTSLSALFVLPNTDVFPSILHTILPTFVLLI